MTLQAYSVGADLLGDITNPMLVFCYDFEVAWIFHQQLQRTVFQSIIVVIQLVPDTHSTSELKVEYMIRK